MPWLACLYVEIREYTRDDYTKGKIVALEAKILP